MTDKGYDSDANRVAARARGITPVIPRRENSKQRGRFFPKRLYKLRARIEQTIGKLKRFKRVAMRCEKTDISYSAIISFACGLMLVIKRRIIVALTTERVLICVADEDRCPCSGPFDADRAAQTRRCRGAIR
jgi:hypothetical protein